jgi:hypothetical protein
VGEDTIRAAGGTAAAAWRLARGRLRRTCPPSYALMRSFFSSGRLVPGATNSGGKSHHKRSQDGNRSLKLSLSHAAVRAIHYDPEIKRWYERTRRAKGPMIARALVAKEIARIVYSVLKHDAPFNGTFKGATLSRIKKSPPWPRRASPAVSLESSARSDPIRRFDWAAVVVPPIISGRARAQPVMVYGRHCGDPWKRCWRAGY